jgi:multiple sugar transport system permease protein
VNTRPLVEAGGRAVPAPRPTPDRPHRRGRLRARTSEALWGYLLIAPTMLGLAIFYLWPAVQTFYFSFTERGAFGGWTWVGLENYRSLLDPELGQSLVNTLVYSLIVVGIGVPLATVVAALLNTDGLRFRSWYRAAFFIPVVTLPAAIGILWRWMFNSDYGVVNQVLGLFGIAGPAWVSDPDIALYAVAFVGVWMTIGYNIVIIVAGMQDVPRTLYEAAQLDGAGPIRRFFSVTVPMISPTLFFVTVLSTIKALHVFDIVYLMVGDTSPAFERVRPIVYFFYQRGFVENDKGFAATVAVVLFVLIAALTAAQFSIQKRWVQQ